jgi:uncharacterized membrane protein
MDNDPAESQLRGIPRASANTTGWFELAAIIIIASALFFIFDLFFHWLARTYDVQILETGRRAKFADVLAAGAALLLTNLTAKLLGIRPSQGKVK